VRALRTALQEVTPVLGDLRQRRAWLHGMDGDARDVRRQRDLARRGVDRGLRGVVIAAGPDIGDVVRDGVVDDRSALGPGGGGLGHGVGLLYVGLDQFGGVPCLGDRLGHDEGKRLSDIAHLTGREHRALGLIGRLAIRHRQGRAGRHVRRCARFRQILGGVDGKNAGRRAGRRDVDGQDPSRRDRRARDGGVHHPRSGKVGGVTAGAGDEPRILDPALEFRKLVHGSLPANPAPTDWAGRDGVGCAGCRSGRITALGTRACASP